MTAPNQPPIDPAALAETKRNCLQNMLDSGHDVLVLLDPRRSGARVPLQFQGDPVLALQLGHNLLNPIPDLEVAEDGVGCTLSFNRRPSWVFIPWHAVFSVRSAIGSILWPEDVPVEARGAMGTAPAAPAPAAGGATVIDLDSHRTPKERRACARRLAAHAKLTAPITPASPDGAA